MMEHLIPIREKHADSFIKKTKQPMNITQL